MAKYGFFELEWNVLIVRKIWRISECRTLFFRINVSRSFSPLRSSSTWNFNVVFSSIYNSSILNRSDVKVILFSAFIAGKRLESDTALGLESDTALGPVQRIIRDMCVRQTHALIHGEFLSKKGSCVTPLVQIAHDRELNSRVWPFTVSKISDACRQ